MTEINLDLYCIEDSYCLTGHHYKEVPKLDPENVYYLFSQGRIVTITYSFFRLLFKDWSSDQIKNNIVFDLGEFINERILNQLISRLELERSITKE